MVHLRLSSTSEREELLQQFYPGRMRRKTEDGCRRGDILFVAMDTDEADERGVGGILNRVCKSGPIDWEYGNGGRQS